MTKISTIKTDYGFYGVRLNENNEVTFSTDTIRTKFGKFTLLETAKLCAKHSVKSTKELAQVFTKQRDEQLARKRLGKKMRVPICPIDEPLN